MVEGWGPEGLKHDLHEAETQRRTAEVAMVQEEERWQFWDIRAQSLRRKIEQEEVIHEGDPSTDSPGVGAASSG